MTTFLDDLVADQRAREIRDRETIPSAILKWAREMREVFGPGVRLRKGVKWPEPKRPGK